MNGKPSLPQNADANPVMRKIGQEGSPASSEIIHFGNQDKIGCHFNKEGNRHTDKIRSLSSDRREKEKKKLVGKRKGNVQTIIFRPSDAMENFAP
jgi:hypothetical protein